MLTGFRRQLAPAPGDPDEAAKLRAENAALAQRVQYLQRHAEQADAARVAAEQQLAALQLAAQQTAALADQIGRMQRTLHAQNDLLQGCRLAHGSNIRASALPPATLDACQWCHRPVTDATAPCAEPACREMDRRLTALFAGVWRRNAALAGHPDIRDEDQAKRRADL